LKALDTVGLSGFERRQARTLSGGESQRVALARSLVLDPDVLLLDEPANHLDMQSVQRTKEIVRHLNGRLGKTVILATHNLAEAKGMARSVVHIFQGRVVSGSPENLFSGRLSDYGSRFDTGRIVVQLPANARAGSHVSVDPAKIVVTRSRPEVESPNVFSGRVVSLSAENGFVTIAVDAGEHFQISTAWSSEHASDLRLGQWVWITLKADGIRLF
jgi:tungstate transport system ATP-binding protein